MKIIIGLLMFVAVSCCSAKKNTMHAAVVTEAKPTNEKDSLSNLPSCINNLIKTFKNEPVTNPPRKIIQYTFKGAIVYYVPSICCDYFSDLYDTNCTLIGHPDGGFTGRGDGSIKNFNEATNEKIIWQDVRTK
ncbi:DUF6970 domain-containing protein [Ferruginibacter yonginensis]|uniref:DUF6970 domain-containing protein n=1 Tax=Ferruginibacter yonginensis TaxID=1310416 RepID=A0ABV8QRF3_9BACT